jgi:hypothetical protein
MTFSQNNVACMDVGPIQSHLFTILKECLLCSHLMTTMHLFVCVSVSQH